MNGVSGASRSLRSSAEGALAVAPVASAVAPVASASAATAGAFQTQVLRGLLDDALEDFREQVRADVLNLQMEMLKQFQIQQVSLSPVSGQCM